MKIKLLLLATLATLAIGCGPLERGEPGEPGECRADDECDPLAPLFDKATCDDGDSTTADRCADGCAAVCTHFRVQCDGFDTPEVQASRCDDGNPCTADRCDVSACAHSAIGNCSP